MAVDETTEFMKAAECFATQRAMHHPVRAPTYPAVNQFATNVAAARLTELAREVVFTRPGTARAAVSRAISRIGSRHPSSF